MIEDDVRARVTARSRALVARDEVALLALLHPQMVWTSPRGEVLDRAGYVAQVTGGVLVFHAQELEQVAVAVAGDTAVVTGIAVDDLERAGTRGVHRMHITQTWVREAGAWRMLAGHAGPPAA